MRHRLLLVFIVLSSVCLFVAAEEPKKAPDDWAMNATIIEACSCPMFCQCYFNPEPAIHGGDEGIHKGHAAGHYCKFNNAYKVNKGHYGSTKLDGAKFWASGDLGPDFRKGETDWIVITFDPSVTPEQREGVAAIMGKVYPVKWKSMTFGKDAPIEWNANNDLATARLDGGKAGEVVLERFPGMTNDPVVIKNLKYFGAQKNDGFVLMPNKVEAYRTGDKQYEFRGTNGFMITFDIHSEPAATEKKAAM